jgi:hypothetical protein
MTAMSRALDAQARPDAELDPWHSPGSSRAGCEAALAAIRAAGPRGVPAPVLLALVMHIGNCSEDAAYQQLRIYVRDRVAIWSPTGSERGRGTEIKRQVWRGI